MPAPIAAAPASPAAAPATSTTAKPGGAAANTPPSQSRPAGEPPPPGEKAVQTSAPPPKPEAPKPAEKRKYKVAKDRELELGDDEVVRAIQERDGLKAERQMTLKERSDFEKSVKLLNDDPDTFFEQNKVDLEGILEARARRREELAKLTPEQREVLALKDQLAKREAADKRRGEQETAQREQFEHRQRVNQTSREIDETIKLGALPRNGHTLRLAAEVQAMEIRAGHPPLSPEQRAVKVEQLAFDRLEGQVTSLLAARPEAQARVLPRVTKMLEGVFEAVAKNEALKPQLQPLLEKLAAVVPRTLPDTELVNFFGKDTAKRMIAAELARLRGSSTPIVATPPASQPSGTAPPNGKKPMNEWELRDAVRRGQ